MYFIPGAAYRFIRPVIKNGKGYETAVRDDYKQ